MKTRNNYKFAAVAASTAIVLGGIIGAPNAFAQELQPSLSEGQFLIPVGQGPVSLSTGDLDQKDPICQVDGERLVGLKYEIFDALCMMAEVHAVQDWYIYSSGASGSAEGNWIRWWDEVSTATRPSGSEFANGYAVGRLIK